MTVYHDMSSSYIKLEKEYFKKASKSIKYEINKYLEENPTTKEINLSTAQHVLARGLGFRNTDSILSAFDKKQPLPIEKGKESFLSFWSLEKINSLFNFLIELNSDKEETRYNEVAKNLIGIIVEILAYERDEQIILFDTKMIEEYLQLDTLVRIYNNSRHVPSSIRIKLFNYLRFLRSPGDGSTHIEPESLNKEHHQRIATELIYPISVVSQLEKYNALIVSPEWYHVTYSNSHVESKHNEKIEYKKHTEQQ